MTPAGASISVGIGPLDSPDVELQGKPYEESRMDRIEAWLENRIFNCRFLTLMAVVGSLVGATLCFIKGSIFVAESVKVFVHHCIKGMNTGKVIMLLVEALDVYLIGTVMLIFGMGLYELFVDTLILPDGAVASSLLRSRSSSLFGLFPLRARPKWLEISSLDEMKTKLGHVIVMILLVGMFEKSKKIVITTAMDLFLFSGSVALAAGCLYLLSKLHSGGGLDDLTSH